MHCWQHGPGAKLSQSRPMLKWLWQQLRACWGVVCPKLVGTGADLVRSQSMSRQATRCKEKAAECQRQALLVSEARLRAVYLELTQQWLEMAQQAEFFDRACRES